MKHFVKIFVVAILMAALSITHLFAGSAIEINRATYDEISTTLTLEGLNFGFFGQPTISIGDSILNSCLVENITIECNIASTPAVGGGSFHVKVSAGNSPHSNAMIDVYIPEGSAECSPGEMAICYSGDPATLGIAECTVGYRYCQNDGTWGSCGGEITPVNEVCDGLDNDCDGLSDEDAVDAKSFYLDADNDSYGTNIGAFLGCEPPSQQYKENGGDCNDNSSDIFPGAQEYCNGVDDDCDGVVDNGGECIADADEDGYFADIDCDDSNPNINPGADEICDGLDNDCDSEVDEDIALRLWFQDRDDDGFGGGDGVQGCSPPQDEYQWSLRWGDCDDNDPNTNPDAREICNDKDDNCRSGIDEGLRLTDYFRDADGDGFGDKYDKITDCAQPEGYIANNNNDCNDLDANVFPGQTNYFSTRNINGDFDYDCNGSEVKKYTYFADYDGYFLGCNLNQPGWSILHLSTIPSCGSSSPWVYDTDWDLISSCDEVIEYKTQECR